MTRGFCQADIARDDRFEYFAGKMFFNFFTKERLIKFLEDAGFRVDYQLETDSQDTDSASDKVIYTIAQK